MLFDGSTLLTRYVVFLSFTFDYVHLAFDLHSQEGG